MSGVAEVIARFGKGASPASGNPFNLSSWLDEPATTAEVEEAWRGHPLPESVMDLWLTVRRARLFEDVDYGQWGLILLAPKDSVERTAKELRLRPGDYQAGDVVLGEFLGDQELLVVSGEAADGHQVLVALPLDHRSDWHVAASGLCEFLEAYWQQGGHKFWEGSDART